MSRVELEGWRAGGHVDADGTRWTINGDLEGWYGTPTVRGMSAPHEGRDGNVSAPPEFGGRSIVIAGQASCRSLAAREAARAKVGRLLTRSRYGVLTVDDRPVMGHSRQAVVSLAADTKVRVQGLSVIYSLHLAADDGLRYSSALSSASATRAREGSSFPIPLPVPTPGGAPGSPGLIACANVGDQDTWPVLRFAGPLTNPAARLVGGGPAVWSNVTLNAGEVLEVDNRTRRVLLNGQLRRQSVRLDAEFFALPAESVSTVQFTAESGSGTCTVEWRSAW